MRTGVTDINCHSVDVIKQRGSVPATSDVGTTGPHSIRRAPTIADPANTSAVEHDPAAGAEQPQPAHHYTGTVPAIATDYSGIIPRPASAPAAGIPGPSSDLPGRLLVPRHQHSVRSGL